MTSILRQIEYRTFFNAWDGDKEFMTFFRKAGLAAAFRRYKERKETASEDIHIEHNNPARSGIAPTGRIVAIKETFQDGWNEASKRKKPVISVTLVAEAKLGGFSFFYDPTTQSMRAFSDDGKIYEPRPHATANVPEKLCKGLEVGVVSISTAYKNPSISNHSGINLG